MSRLGDHLQPIQLLPHRRRRSPNIPLTVRNLTPHPQAEVFGKHPANMVARMRSRLLLLALLLLALSSSAAFPCSLCEAGYESCGVCLNRVQRTECPGSDVLDSMANCTGVLEGDLCEADGECGTSTVLNNCEDMNFDGPSPLSPAHTQHAPHAHTRALLWECLLRHQGSGWYGRCPHRSERAHQPRASSAAACVCSHTATLSPTSP